MHRARSTLALALMLACVRGPEHRPQSDPAPPIPTHPAVGSLADLPLQLAAAFVDTPPFPPLAPTMATLARHTAAFFGLEVAIDDEQRRALILERSLKIMSHELTHSFGIRHCIHYDCLMNGSNHLGEVDIHPIHVCPVCLRKLHVALDLDPVARYRQLGDFYRDHAMADQAAWTEARVDYLSTASW